MKRQFLEEMGLTKEQVDKNKGSKTTREVYINSSNLK